MEDPMAALLEARRILKPDGVLVIADLINIDSFCARVFGEGHRLIHPMHFTYFSPSTITYHLGRTGFTVTEIEYPYFRTPYFTVANIAKLMGRVLAQSVNRVTGRRHARVYSVPFYGNMMDVWARPA
jgi:SAM-dependent methyltransferase